MPQRSQLHVDKLLSNVSVQYKNEEYIADKICPVVPVEKDSDKYRIYDKNWRIPEAKRAPKGLAKEFQFNYSLASYSVDYNALKDYVGVDEERNNDQGSVRADCVENLTDALLRVREDRVASLYTTSNWSLNVSLSAGAKFSDATTTSNPIPVYDTAAATIIANSGKTPNHGWITHAGLIALKNHPSVLDRVKYTSSNITEDMLASLIGIPAGQLFVAKAQKNTAAEGVADSNSNFFGSASFIGWKSNSPSLRAPSCVYNFEVSEPRVKTWIDSERNDAEGIEVQMKDVPKVVASLTGYLINGVV
jgi:hypothetical protein